MVLKSSLPEVPIEKLNLSFSGCGFLGIYHMGVACCFHKYLPQICERQISGASAGSLVAAALACNLNLGKCACHILEVAIKARHRALGPFHPNFNVNEIMLNALNEVLPPNAHELVNGKLNISVTRVSDGQNCILSHFETRADLIQAIICSCFIPFWSGYIPPKFQGIAYMDGGFSKNLLILDENTITISPFSGESDICPLDSTYNAYKINFSNTSISLSLENLYRLTRILFPPEPEIMGLMCQQGFYDALRYLQRNNRIACTRCIAVQSSYVMNEEDAESAKETEEQSDEDDETYLFKSSHELNELNRNLQSLNSSFNNLIDLDYTQDDYTIRNELSDEEIDEELRKLVEFSNRMNNKRKDEKLKEEFIQAMEQDYKQHSHRGHNCKNCQSRKENLHKENLPENVNQAIQEACDKVNKGLVNYIFKFRIMKILSTLTVPYVLPFDITIALLNKLRKLLPIVTSELSASLRRVILFAISLVNNVKDKEIINMSNLANFNYKVALTEFNYTDHLKNIKDQNSRLRKISTSSAYSVDLMYENEKAKMQKSNSFRLDKRTNSIEDIRHKLKRIYSNENLAANSNCTDASNHNTNNTSSITSASNAATANSNQMPPSINDVKKLKRKSFAGNELNNLKNLAPERRVSMLDFIGIKQPERVLSKMNLNFSIDLNDINNENADLNHNFHHNFNNNNIATTETICGPTSRPETPAPIAFANNALNLGINDIEHHQEQNIERFNSKLKELTTSKEALMAFHFTDDDNNVQVMEIFNVSDIENNDSVEDEEEELASDLIDPNDQQEFTTTNSQYEQAAFERRERKKSVLFR